MKSTQFMKFKKFTKSTQFVEFKNFIKLHNS